MVHWHKCERSGVNQFVVFPAHLQGFLHAESATASKIYNSACYYFDKKLAKLHCLLRRLEKDIYLLFFILFKQNTNLFKQNNNLFEQNTINLFKQITNLFKQNNILFQQNT